MAPKKTRNTAKTGNTSSSDRLCPGFPTVAATLTNRRQGWNTNMINFDRERIAFFRIVQNGTTKNEKREINETETEKTNKTKTERNRKGKLLIAFFVQTYT